MIGGSTLLLSLDIGCGKRKSFDINVDINKRLKPDIACDAQYLPFKSESFDLIHCSHLLEHVDNPNLVIEEIKRVAKPNAKIIIKSPRPEYISNTKYYLSLLIFNFFSPFFLHFMKRIIKGCREVQKRDVGSYHKWVITREYLMEHLKLEQEGVYGSVCQAVAFLEKRMKFKIKRLAPNMILVMRK